MKAAFTSLLVLVVLACCLQQSLGKPSGRREELKRLLQEVLKEDKRQGPEGQPQEEAGGDTAPGGGAPDAGAPGANPDGAGPGTGADAQGDPEEPGPSGNSHQVPGEVGGEGQPPNDQGPEGGHKSKGAGGEGGEQGHGSAGQKKKSAFEEYIQGAVGEYRDLENEVQRLHNEVETVAGILGEENKSGVKAGTVPGEGEASKPKGDGEEAGTPGQTPGGNPPTEEEENLGEPPEGAEGPPPEGEGDQGGPEDGPPGGQGGPPGGQGGPRGGPGGSRGPQGGQGPPGGQPGGAKKRELAKLLQELIQAEVNT